MNEEDYWASDPGFHEVIESAAARGEMLLSEGKSKQPNFGDYQIKPLYESNPWQPARTYYMVPLLIRRVPFCAIKLSSVVLPFLAGSAGLWRCKGRVSNPFG